MPPRRSRRTAHEPLRADDLVGAVITALVRGVRDPSRVSVKSDRRTLCTMDEVTVVSLRLRKELVIDDVLAARLVRGAEVDRLRAAALRRVARSMCSARQLGSALLRRGASKDDADELVEDFRRRGLVDDAAYAEAKARVLAAVGKSGRRLIESKLRGAGIGATTAREAAARAAQLRDEEADALRLAERRAAALRGRVEADAARRRVIGALSRRGYDADTVRRAVERAMGRRG